MMQIIKQCRYIRIGVGEDVAFAATAFIHRRYDTVGHIAHIHKIIAAFNAGRDRPSR